MSLLRQALFLLVTSVLTASIMAPSTVNKQEIRRKTDLAKQGILMRPGFMNPMMFLLPLGITAMMLPFMTLMFATLAGGAGLLGKRRRRDVDQEDGKDEIQWRKSVKGILRVLDILERALEKYKSDDRDEDSRKDTSEGT